MNQVTACINKVFNNWTDIIDYLNRVEFEYSLYNIKYEEEISINTNTLEYIVKITVWI